MQKQDGNSETHYPQITETAEEEKSSRYGAVWWFPLWRGWSLTLPSCWLWHVPSYVGAPLSGERLRVQTSVNLCCPLEMELFFKPRETASSFLTTSFFWGKCSQRRYPFTSVSWIQLTSRKACQVAGPLGGSKMEQTQFLFCPVLQGVPI